MSLIQCKECRKTISDAVIKCPNCGYKNKRINVLNSIFETKNYVITILCNIIIIIIGFFLVKKGHYKILFWSEMKSELGVEDAMYCINNLNKYFFMKNIGIAIIVISVIFIATISFIKIFKSNKISD